MNLELNTRKLAVVACLTASCALAQPSCEVHLFDFRKAEETWITQSRSSIRYDLPGYSLIAEASCPSDGVEGWQLGIVQVLVDAQGTNFYERGRVEVKLKQSPVRDGSIEPAEIPWLSNYRSYASAKGYVKLTAYDQPAGRPLPRMIFPQPTPLLVARLNLLESTFAMTLRTALALVNTSKREIKILRAVEWKTMAKMVPNLPPEGTTTTRGSTSKLEVREIADLGIPNLADIIFAPLVAHKAFVGTWFSDDPALPREKILE